MKENQQAVTRAVRYIEEHLGEEIMLEEIASAAGYSKSHLNRMFAESTGKTIHKYIQEKRLERAADRLRNSDMSIVDIALEAGYASQQAFTLAFRNMYELTPQAYRQWEFVVLKAIEIPSGGKMSGGPILLSCIWRAAA